MNLEELLDDMQDEVDTRKMFKISYKINLLPMLDEYILVKDGVNV